MMGPLSALLVYAEPSACGRQCLRRWRSTASLTVCKCVLAGCTGGGVKSVFELEGLHLTSQEALMVVVMEYCDLGSLRKAITRRAFVPHGKWSFQTTYVSVPCAGAFWVVGEQPGTLPCCSVLQELVRGCDGACMHERGRGMGAFLTLRPAALCPPCSARCCAPPRRLPRAWSTSTTLTLCTAVRLRPHDGAALRGLPFECALALLAWLRAGCALCTLAARELNFFHCIPRTDLKPGNVLLRTHKVDRRGYIAKVGLSMGGQAALLPSLLLAALC